MSDFPITPEISTDNQRSLKILINSINRNNGKFSLILVRCNYRCLQKQVKEWLYQNCPERKELSLSSHSQALSTAIKIAIEDTQPRALSVYNLDLVNNLDNFLSGVNKDRGKLAKQCSFPLILWLTDEVLAKMSSLAPDFYSFTGSLIYFKLTPANLLNFLHQELDNLFANSLNGNLEDVVNSHSQEKYLLRREAEWAKRDLLENEYTIDPDLEASLEFSQAQDDYQQGKIETAIENYQNSLAFWQESNNLERQGILSFYLGLCYLRQAELNRAESNFYWEAADIYLQQCLAAFENGELRELKAKFIGYRGEVLKLLERWEELKHLVAESLKLRQIYNNPLELARDYGFLAEIALNHNQNNSAACENARQALKILEVVTDSEKYQGQYLLSLAQGQKNLGESQQAIATLQQAYHCSNANHNPRLYIAILETLSKVYFEDKNYKEAFQFKQKSREIKNQYGFLAFIGAGCLQSPHQPKNFSENPATVAQEIAVSGRQQDVENLVKRIVVNTEHRITIIHGQLGVGKSSTIKAGLIPSLQQEMFEDRDVMPICLQAYTNWSNRLGEELVKQLQTRLKSPPETINTISEITEQLERNDKHKLFTVLIFDQFEEFFFVHRNSTARKELFGFLSYFASTKVPYVKIILSLREDYLHYLLEWERYNNLEAINRDILSRDKRYELRNFSVADARNIIQTLTQRSQFDLEPALINQVVADLAGEEAEIRPIELQVVGAELQSEKIKTLAQYQQLGENAKEKLVENYLEAVVKDCGEENEDAARIVLYLLTGENNTRPTKTRAEIEIDLRAVEKDLTKQAEKLDLVLNIFQQSGLIFLLPEIPDNRYQLIHDYLVSFIRKKQPKIDELVKELEEKRQQLEVTEGKLRISELEKEIVEERQRRGEVELNLFRKEQNFNNRNFALVMIAVSILISIGFGSKIYSQSESIKTLTRDKKNLEDALIKDGEFFQARIGYLKNEKIIKTVKLAEELFVQKKIQLALDEAVEAGELLLETYSKNDEGYYFSLGAEYYKKYRSTENLNQLFQKTPTKVIDLLIKVTQEDDRYLYKVDVGKLKPEKQCEVLQGLLSKPVYDSEIKDIKTEDCIGN